MNNYYVQTDNHNFLGCTTPDSQAVSLPGFAQDHDYYITWFPTRMNATVPANDTVVSTWAGTVRLDFSDNPLHGLLNNYLDTLHSDYAFILAPYPVTLRMIAQNETDSTFTGSDWEFTMFPNPANDVLHILLPTVPVSKDIALFDLSGKCAYSRMGLTSLKFDIPIAHLARGTYCVKISDSSTNKTKVLVIN